MLNEEGDFVGFDVVIGNPPYVQIKEISETDKSFLRIIINFQTVDLIYFIFSLS